MTAGLSSKRDRSAKPSKRMGSKRGGVLTIREVQEQKAGYSWTTYLVQGWRDGTGNWQKKRFRDRSDAEAFVALKNVELLNNDTRLREVVTSLSATQVKEAESAFSRLAELESADGGLREHTLNAAVEYYLKHHDTGSLESITLGEAKRKFLDAKETEGVRHRSIIQLKATLRQFEDFMNDCIISEITTSNVYEYLNSVRSKDGKRKASKKTFNNYRADLHGFFSWCIKQSSTAGDGSKVRWLTENPVSSIEKQKETQRDVPETLTVTQIKTLLSYVENFKGSKEGLAGIMAPYFAIALFAGLRTGDYGELHKLAHHAEHKKLIDLERGVIHIKPEISKTGQYRQVIIRPALKAWLVRYGLNLLPPNATRHIKTIRKHFNIGHDVLRHTFFSMHIAAFKSVGGAAIEGGNTEQVVKKHYLNLATYTEGAHFWKIRPKKTLKK